MNLTLFDLDGTLIPGDSDHAFGAHMVEIGWTEGEAWRARNDQFYADYCAGQLDLDAYIAFTTSAWRNRAAAEVAEMQQRFMSTVMAAQIRPEARALIDKHRMAGDLIAIVTATNEFVTRPIAHAFGVEHLIAVELERVNGAYTGRIRGTPSFKEGKIRRVHEWLAGLGRQWAEFERVTVYSDSINDLPLLEAASHPVATNPAPSLAHIAGERGWPILNLFA
ncbi:MAG: HAD family hydrolase [Paucibacter sp.]|nr:HAD family hydrolase [Roseateles sp.]